MVRCLREGAHGGGELHQTPRSEGDECWLEAQAGRRLAVAINAPSNNARLTRMFSHIAIYIVHTAVQIIFEYTSRWPRASGLKHLHQTEQHPEEDEASDRARHRLRHRHAPLLPALAIRAPRASPGPKTYLPYIGTFTTFLQHFISWAPRTVSGGPNREERLLHGAAKLRLGREPRPALAVSPKLLSGPKTYLP